MTRRVARRRLSAIAVALLLVTGCSAPDGGSPDGSGSTKAAMTAQQAKTITDRVFLDARAVTAADMNEALRQARTSYTGPALEAAAAASVMRRASVARRTWLPITAGMGGPLGVASGTTYPRLILAQTTAADGMPHLHVFQSPDATTPQRIAFSAPLVPGAQITAFADLQAGQGVETFADRRDLSVAPQDVLRSYSDALLAGGTPPTGPDPFATQVVANARSVDRSVAKSATVVRTAALRADSVRAFRQANGGALVVGVIDRTTTLNVKDGHQLKPSPEFAAIQPKVATIHRQAVTTTYQFLAFAVPTNGPAKLVAATEQMVAASGV